MDNFRFENKTSILFGKETQLQVGEYVKQYADHILLVYGGKSIKNNGLYAQICNSLQSEKIDYKELCGIEPNPRMSKVLEGVRMCKEFEIDFILAVGGGSVIDAAKAVALGVENENIWEYFNGGMNSPKVNVKIGVVVTIAASGSESSGSTVITNDLLIVPEKKDFTSNLLRPQFAILNPELTVTVSWEQTAYGGMDIISHIMERYFTKVKNVELTDRMCEAVLVTVIHNLKILMKHPDNYDARAEIMWAGTIAHNNLLSTGRRSDWATHKIEHELSAKYDIPHGKGLAMIIPAWMRYVYHHDLKRFSQFAERVWGITNKSYDEELYALQGIKELECFMEELGLPLNTCQLELTEIDIKHIAENVTRNGSIGDFVQLDEEDVINILILSGK